MNTFSQNNPDNERLRSTYKRSASTQKGMTMRSTFSASLNKPDNEGIVMNRNLLINSTKVKTRSPKRENFNLTATITRSNFEEVSFRPAETVKER
jgi:hypothetical protein